MVSRQIDRMYIGFQYQDRINQMMTLLYEDISRLQSLLADPACEAQALSQSAWLARLESQYAMVEQHDAQGASTASKALPTPGEDSEADFF
jgi:methyl-accepting chemotaxis protein